MYIRIAPSFNVKRNKLSKEIKVSKTALVDDKSEGLVNNVLSHFVGNYIYIISKVIPEVPFEH